MKDKDKDDINKIRKSLESLEATEDQIWAKVRDNYMNLDSLTKKPFHEWTERDYRTAKMAAHIVMGMKCHREAKELLQEIEGETA